MIERNFRNDQARKRRETVQFRTHCREYFDMAGALISLFWELEAGNSGGADAFDGEAQAHGFQDGGDDA
jgi:hypothetical protein